MDRVLGNEAWIQKFTWSNVIFLNPGISDHSPAMVYMEQKSEIMGTRFKFCNFWIKHPAYYQIVSEEWMREIDGVPMYRIVKKLKSLKGRL